MAGGEGGRGEDVIFLKIAPPIGYYGYTNLHRVSIGLGRGEGGGGREGRTSRDTVLDEECEICIVVLYVLYCYTKCTMYHAQTPIHVHTCMYMLLHVHATTCQYMYMPLHVHTYICRGAGRDGVAELVEGGDIRTNLQSLCSNSHTGQENLGDEGVHLQTFCTCHMKLQSTSCTASGYVLIHDGIVVIVVVVVGLTHTHTPPRTSFFSHLGLLEEEHDRVYRVIPHTDTGQKDTVKVEFEDGHGNVHKEFVRS